MKKNVKLGWLLSMMFVLSSVLSPGRSHGEQIHPYLFPAQTKLPIDDSILAASSPESTLVVWKENCDQARCLLHGAAFIGSGTTSDLGVLAEIPSVTDVFRVVATDINSFAVYYSEVDPHEGGKIMALDIIYDHVLGHVPLYPWIVADLPGVRIVGFDVSGGYPDVPVLTWVEADPDGSRLGLMNLAGVLEPLYFDLSEHAAKPVISRGQVADLIAWQSKRNGSVAIEMVRYDRQTNQIMEETHEAHESTNENHVGASIAYADDIFTVAWQVLDQNFEPLRLTVIEMYETDGSYASWQDYPYGMMNPKLSMLGGVVLLTYVLGDGSGVVGSLSGFNQPCGFISPSPYGSGSLQGYSVVTHGLQPILVELVESNGYVEVRSNRVSIGSSCSIQSNVHGLWVPVYDHYSDEIAAAGDWWGNLLVWTTGRGLQS